MLAIVLARKNWREFDQLVSLYTLKQGKVEALAKGIKKMTSKNSANLKVLSMAEIEIAPGKEINHLIKVHPVKIFKNIYFDVDKIFLANYIITAVDENILGGESDERIFNLVISFLEFLDSTVGINYLNLVTGFIFKFWHCLGFSTQEKKDSIWLQADWPKINNFSLSKEEQINAYKKAKGLVLASNNKLTDWLVLDKTLANFRGNDKIERLQN